MLPIASVHIKCFGSRGFLMNTKFRSLLQIFSAAATLIDSRFEVSISSRFSSSYFASLSFFFLRQTDGREGTHEAATSAFSGKLALNSSPSHAPTVKRVFQSLGTVYLHSQSNQQSSTHYQDVCVYFSLDQSYLFMALKTGLFFFFPSTVELDIKFLSINSSIYYMIT